WSYKLITSRIRTQILTDINENIINVSNSQLYCVALDGGYTLFIKQFESFCKN
ncbi:hypothetical protein BDA99DRAFT_420460, partial [Phascolomyces articulosus]